MTVRNIKKSLAGVEDLAIGIGKLQQERGVVHRVNVFPSSYSYTDMQQYGGGDFFRLYGSDTFYTDYRRNPAGTVGIPSGAGGVWEPLLGNDKSVGGNSTNGAYLVDNSYVLWHAGTASYYGWAGIFPHVVAPGTDPAAVAGYMMRSDAGLREQINTDFPEDFGAAGDGIADDTIAITSLIAGTGAASYLRKGARYLVTTISNALGKPFAGSGHVVKPVTGGLEAQNTYADKYQRCTGQENLAYWLRSMYNECVTPTKKLKIVFSGDSTTAGVGVDTAYQIQNLVLTGITERGLQTINNISVVNAGHSGSPTNDWDSTFVTQDIAQAPDLYVVRWGINDPGWMKTGGAAPIDAGQSYPGRRDISDFAASLRSGLAKYRAAIPFSAGSILLMMPNSTYDIPNARDALWYEQLRDVYVQAARDFRCAFIDTYAIMQDSRGLAGILMDDPMATTGRGIHPNNAMNSIIAGYIVDMIAPHGLRTHLATNKIFSIGGNGLAVPASLTPDSYGASIYMIRCLTSAGWPLDGGAITFRTADDICVQYHFGWTDADRGKLKIRFGRSAVLAGQPIGWSAWYDAMGGAAQFLSSLVTPASGWATPAAGGMRISAEGGMRCVDGYITKTSPGIVAANTQVGTVAPLFCPFHESVYCVATVWNGSSFEQVPARIGTDSNIVLLKATTISVQRLYVNASYNANA